MEKTESTGTRWLKSPITEISEKENLKPMRELRLEPYHGSKRTLKLFRTHYLIGSGRGCDIQLNDPFICPEHGELRLERNGYAYTDLGSKNGSFLNGVKVKSAPLPAWGSIRIGRSSLVWKKEQDFSVEEGWIVADPAMQEILDRVKRTARSNLPVLLLGETGTGKEILARIIHRASQRASHPYVTVNGALTGGSLAESELFGHKKGAFTGAESPRRGALRMAHGGSLFLDEVADIPAAAQVKLLRALESGEVRPLGSDEFERADFRLVSATSQNLDKRVADGEFRLDLYYRLAGFVVHIPPLRDRPLDISAIAKALLEEAGLELGPEGEAKLLSYSWPGNVRELRSCLNRAALTAKEEGAVAVSASHIWGLERQAHSNVSGRSFTLAEVERDCIRASLERNGWVKGVAARELGIARSTLFEKMKKYSLRDSAN
jgi:transcriptional regulator with GAF, ATPase, and Fis domain